MIAADEPDWLGEHGRLAVLLALYSGMPDTVLLRVPLGVLRELSARPAAAVVAGSAAALAGRLERILAVRAAGQRP